MDDKKKDRVVNPAIDDIKKIITNIKKYDATFYYLNDFTVNIKGDFTKEDIENNEIISSGIDKFIYKATKEVIDKFIEEFKTEKINKTEKLLKIF